VDDTSTGLFFSTFYQKLKFGQSKVLALRETMLHLMNTPQISSYFCWGRLSCKGIGNNSHQQAA
jgi:CHAT domain-containing protein